MSLTFTTWTHPIYLLISLLIIIVIGFLFLYFEAVVDHLLLLTEWNRYLAGVWLFKKQCISPNICFMLNPINYKAQSANR